MADPHTPFPTVRVAVVVHSGFGHTRVVADSVATGARSVPGVSATVIAVDEAPDRWDELDRADAIIFGSPTYMAGVSAPFKAFMDATSDRWASQAWRGKLAAGFTNSAGLNGDKLGTLQHLSLFAAQHSMLWVSLGLLPGATSSDAPPGALNRLASFLGAMTQSPTDLDAKHAPNAPDLMTAEKLGERVARTALGWRGESEAKRDQERAAIALVLQAYFDGLFESDTEQLSRAFHSEARYVDAKAVPLKPLSLAEYLPVVAERPAPASQAQPRTDRILSIDFAGNTAAIARVECSLGTKSFADLLTLVHTPEGWQLISKVFHYDVVQP